MSPLACVVCSVDPQTTSLILPLAQATVIAAPVILRAELRKGVQALRARGSRRRAARGPAAGPSPSAAGQRREAERGG